MSKFSSPKQSLLWYNLIKPNQMYHAGKAKVNLQNFDVKTNKALLQNQFLLQYSTEQELVQCGKSAFIGDNAEINRWQRYLGTTYKSTKFYVGRNPIPIFLLGWNFNVYAGTKGERIPTLFKNAMERGILQRELDLEREFVIKNRRTETSRITGILNGTKLVEGTSEGIGDVFRQFF